MPDSLCFRDLLLACMCLRVEVSGRVVAQAVCTYRALAGPCLLPGQAAQALCPLLVHRAVHVVLVFP